MISAKNPVRITKRPAGTDGAVLTSGGAGRAWSTGAYESHRIDRRAGRRRPRPQVSDLGAAASGRTSREGHRAGAHPCQTFRLTAYRVGRRGTGMMTGSASGNPDVAGGPARHIPVLVRPVVEHLGVRAGGIYIDGTFGAGGYARAILAAAAERTLADIIFALGEERHSRAVARAIVKARAETPIRTTRALADIVGRVVHGRPGDIHPATRTFQALRLFVNDELGELQAGLLAAERILKPGGRLVVVSFHSLEDRIVKTFLAARAGTRAGSRPMPQAAPRPASLTLLPKRPVGPDEAEMAANPPARPAKLRAAQRSAAPVNASDLPALPRLPSLADVIRKG